MSLPDKNTPFKSLIHHEFSIEILKLISDQRQLVNFGSIMEQLGISKRALYLTLKDLESEDLITQTKQGRKSIISLTEEGKNALVDLNQQSKKNKEEALIDYQAIIETTIKQLESEGIISKDWTAFERKEFIKKLSSSIISTMQRL